MGFMKIQKLASILHKYLGLIIGIQIFIWVSTGLFFAVFPIEEIRSEHRIKEVPPIPYLAQDYAGLNAVLTQNPKIQKLRLETTPIGPLIIGEIEKAKISFDGKTGTRISPLNQGQAEKIASDYVANPTKIKMASLVKEESTEYRSDLPAWKIDFEDGLSVYVGQNTGLVAARRSNLWRTYDFLWSLHIMDYKNHEDFNHPLLIMAGLLAVLTAIGGLVLLPFRVKFRRRKST